MSIINWLTKKVKKDIDSELEPEEKQEAITRYNRNLPPSMGVDMVESEDKTIIQKPVKESKIILKVVGAVKGKNWYKTIYATDGYNLHLVVPARSLLLKGIELKEGDRISIKVEKISKEKK